SALLALICCGGGSPSSPSSQPSPTTGLVDADIIPIVCTGNPPSLSLGCGQPGLTTVQRGSDGLYAIPSYDALEHASWVALGIKAYCGPGRVVTVTVEQGPNISFSTYTSANREDFAPCSTLQGTLGMGTMLQAPSPTNNRNTF